MTDEQIHNLFRKYYDKTASEKERRELLHWIANDENREKVEWYLQMYYDEEFDTVDHTTLEIDPHVIIQRMRSVQSSNEILPKKRRWIKPFAIAASVVMVLGAYLFYQNRTQQSLSVHTIAYDIPAGGNRAILTLSDGNRVILDSLSEGAAINEGNIRIVKSSDGQVTYSVNASGSHPGSYNTIETPIGGFYQIHLPDGTRVWLNALSSLKFPTSFPSDIRQVQLKGEAYFEVAKDKAKPFVVDVNDMQVKVLGTHFNINSYTPQSAIYTTVLEGAVAVSNAGLAKTVLPGQQLQYNGAHTMHLANEVDVTQITAWKEGFFSRKAISLKDLMDEVSRWYGVKVVYSEPIQAEFVAKLPKDISLRELITLLELTGEVTFDLNLKTLKIMKTKT